MKIAIVGCQGWGKIHLNVLKKLEGVEYYVFSRNEEKAKECLREFNAYGYFTNYDDVLSSNIDIVDLVVSHDMHYEMGVRALKSGKHLMLEKPIDKTIAEAEGLIKVAKEVGRKFMVLEQFSFDSSVKKAKELINELGKISLIIVRSTHFNRPKDWRREKSKMGGGALIDGGVHFIDTLLNLGGEYEDVKAYCGKYFSGLEGEDTSLATFKFKSGA